MRNHVITADPSTPVHPMPIEPARTPSSREERAAQLTATVDTAVEDLAGQLAAGHTARFLAYLAFASRFHRYSWNNTVRIQAQCPHATRVAGLRTWNRLGHRITAGSTAIWVWAPIVKRAVNEATGREEERVVAFRPVPTFDVSQLSTLAERPLPTPLPPLPDDAEEAYAVARRRIEATGIVVEERPLPGNIEGVSLGGRIVVRAGLSSRRRLWVLTHELAHELLHHGEEPDATPRAQRELEAEGVSFVVGAVLGVENTGARDYLLTYGITPEALRNSLATIQGTVRRVLAILGEPEPATQELKAA